MQIKKMFFILPCIVGMSACAGLPGLRYQDGGSDVWKGEPGQPGYNPDLAIKVSEITPNLTLKMAQEVADKNRTALSQVQVGSAVYPWIYRVGVGDVLSVIVWDHPELTNPTGSTQGVDSSGRIVRPDGTIFYPHAGSIQVAGKTTEEIAAILTRNLAAVIQSPQVDVTVIGFRSQFVNVVGDVDQPCRVPITDMPLTVIDAMNGCKTIRPSVGRRDIELSFNGERRSVDLYDIYRGSDPLLSQPLAAGSILSVKDDRDNRIFVIGEVTRQAALTIPVSGLSLADALNDKDIGGMRQDAVDARNVYVFRGGISEADLKDGHIDGASFQPDIYHIDLKSPDAFLLADQFHLQPRDIVFTSIAPLVSYGRVASTIIPTVSALLQSVLIIRAVR